MFKDILKYPIYLSSTIGFLMSVIMAYNAIQYLWETDGERKSLMLIVAFVFCTFAIINVAVIFYFILRKHANNRSKKGY